MANRIFKNTIACFGACSSGGESAEATIVQDGLLWYKDFGRYGSGDYSMAVLQGNRVLEDQCQIESGPFGTFVGVYDGHGGPEAARFVCDRIFQRFQEILAEHNGSVTGQIIRDAFLRMVEEFFTHVGDLQNAQPNIAISGTCCLVGVVYQKMLFVANSGDSRAVLGEKNKILRTMIATQLSTEHNVNIDEIRAQVLDRHPEDPNFVSHTRGSWRVKGIIQISRSIGDAYLKRPEYNTDAIEARFRLPPPHDHMPYLDVEPDIHEHQLLSDDSFIIFASDGLWEHLTNSEAVEIVHRHQHSGSARQLINRALEKAAVSNNMPYERLCEIDKSNRRSYHDDITVIVLFLNQRLIARGSVTQTPVSVRSALDH
ncbi:unnamed protein product [Rhodiola kirilowii]